VVASEYTGERASNRGRAERSRAWQTLESSGSSEVKETESDEE